MAEEDEELHAIQSVISALSPLDDGARARVLEYVFKRLGLAAATVSRGHSKEILRRTDYTNLSEPANTGSSRRK